MGSTPPETQKLADLAAVLASDAEVPGGVRLRIALDVVQRIAERGVVVRARTPNGRLRLDRVRIDEDGVADVGEGAGEDSGALELVWEILAGRPMPDGPPPRIGIVVHDLPMKIELLLTRMLTQTLPRTAHELAADLESAGRGFIDTHDDVRRTFARWMREVPSVPVASAAISPVAPDPDEMRRPAQAPHESTRRASTRMGVGRGGSASSHPPSSGNARRGPVPELPPARAKGVRTPSPIEDALANAAAAAKRAAQSRPAPPRPEDASPPSAIGASTDGAPPPAALSSASSLQHPGALEASSTTPTAGEVIEELDASLLLADDSAGEPSSQPSRSWQPSRPGGPGDIGERRRSSSSAISNARSAAAPPSRPFERSRVADGLPAARPPRRSAWALAVVAASVAGYLAARAHGTPPPSARQPDATPTSVDTPPAVCPPSQPGAGSEQTASATAAAAPCPATPISSSSAIAEAHPTARVPAQSSRPRGIVGGGRAAATPRPTVAQGEPPPPKPANRYRFNPADL